MSNSSTTVLDRTAGRTPGRDTLRRGAALAAVPLRFVGFWAAIALPFLYLPLLYGGLQGDQVLVFCGLLAANVASLVLGHKHGR